MSKKTFMGGAVILGVAGIVVKVIGAFFRIPLINIIGADGIAYYQSVYPIYVLFLTIATAGIPVAVSRMVSERISGDNYWGANNVFKISLYIMIALGVLLFSIAFFGADFIIGRIEGMDEAVYALRAIAPALFFVPVMATFRGYFQGMQNMRPTALSQVFEQLFRLIVGLSLAIILLSKGKAIAAAGATFGATAGSFMGFLVVFLLYKLLKTTKYYKTRMEESRIEFIGQYEKPSKIIKQVFAIAIPITLGAAIMPIMQSVDSVLVINRLVATGWDTDLAQSMFGQLTGFAASLVNLPQVITQAIAISLVPTIATAFSKKDHEFVHHNVQLGVRTAMIIGLPCTIGLVVLAQPIMLLLYPLQKADAIAAADALTVLGLGVIFLSLVQTLTSILQGVGKQNIPAINLLIGAIIKIVLTYILTGIPALNIRGAAIGTITAYFIATALNYIAVKKYTGTKFDIGLTYIKPVIAVAGMGIAAYASYFVFSLVLGNSISTVGAVAVAGITYIVLLFVTGSIKEEELIEFPKGDKLHKVYKKVIRK